MSEHLRLFLLVGTVAFLLFMLYMLNKGKLTVKYSLLWLAFAAVMLLFAGFPYIVYVIRDLLDMVMPVNVVFVILFCFVLMLLLSLSVAVCQLSEKNKQLTQASALLEKRVRLLEGSTANHPDKKDK